MLICPGCGRSADIVWRIGEGPNTGPGEGPAYVAVHETGGWRVETIQTARRWTGAITCPDCGTEVETGR
jgi:uncharacterized protein (UPF0212 family)